MRLSKGLVVWLAFTLASAFTARAATYNATFLKSGGQWACADLDRKAEPPGALVVAVRVNGDVPSDVAFVLEGSVSANLTRLGPQEPDWKVEVSRASIGAGAVRLVGTLDGKRIPCSQEFKPFGAASDSSDASREQEILDGPALLWWARHAKGALAELRKSQGYDQSTLILPHLPSGAAAPRNFRSAPETASLQVAVLMPKDAPRAYEVAVTTCPEREDFRLLGDASVLGTLQAAVNEFELVPVGDSFRCGEGMVVYTVRPIAPGAEAKQNKVPLRPVYHLASTFGLGWDFEQEATFAKEDDKVARIADPIGPGLRAGFTWFPWGLDYERVHWYNRFFNPALLVDPKEPTKSFVIGTTIAPGRWALSILVGASIHKVAVPKGLDVGDAFTGDGEVPTREKWSENGVGWFVGVALDQTLFTRLKGAFSTTDQNGADQGNTE
ncbi:MAG TPA: hypothetical protein VGS57_22780 [Thermoanaerobaculia bacterium]|jgi:hypothetical protein|nr:hypothetical protein [Thermoanaerobaculia bacterium]